MTRDDILAGFLALDDALVPKPDKWRLPAGAPESAQDEVAESMVRAADLWAAVLEDVTVEDFRVAILTRIREAPTWWPTVGQVLALVPKRRMLALDDSAQAFADVEQWMRRGPGREGTYVGHGYSYPEPKPGEIDADDEIRDALLAETLRLCGGNAAWKKSQESEAVWLRKRFIETYGRAKEARMARMEADGVVRLADHAAARRAITDRGGAR